jgi:hypothetical protein
VVECDLAKVEVAGSNPVSRSIYNRIASLQSLVRAATLASREEGKLRTSYLNERESRKTFRVTALPSWISHSRRIRFEASQTKRPS